MRDGFIYPKRLEGLPHSHEASLSQAAHNGIARKLDAGVQLAKRDDRDRSAVVRRKRQDIS
jgi:hypothetical protein